MLEKALYVLIEISFYICFCQCCMMYKIGLYIKFEFSKLPVDLYTIVRSTVLPDFQQEMITVFSVFFLIINTLLDVFTY